MFSRNKKEGESENGLPKRTVFIGRAEYAFLFGISLADVDRLIYDGRLHAQIAGTILVVKVDAEEVEKRRSLP